MQGDLIYGQNDNGEAVVIHLARPRLIMRVVEVDETGEALHPDEDADLLSGLTYAGEYNGGAFALCEGAKLDDDGDYNLSSTISLMARFVAMHLESEHGSQAMEAEELSDLIAASGLSLSAVAAKMGIDPRALRRMAKGESDVPVGLAVEMRRRWAK